MSEIVQVVGKNIRNLRKETGWTQEKLAEKAGISVPFMTQIELGRKSASLEVIENIAKALGVSYERLFQTESINNNDIQFKLHIFETELTNSVVENIKNSFNKLSL